MTDDLVSIRIATAGETILLGHVQYHGQRWQLKNRQLHALKQYLREVHQEGARPLHDGIGPTAW